MSYVTVKIPAEAKDKKRGMQKKLIMSVELIRQLNNNNVKKH